MDFVITKEQLRMQKAAREFLKATFHSEFVRAMEADDRGFTPDTWEKMGSLDWMALAVPEPYEGVGGALMDLVLLLEELGRVGATGPFFPTVVIGAAALARFGSEAQKRRWLPDIANARIRATLALEEPGTTRYDPFWIETAAAAENDAFVISGTKLFVPDAHVADAMLCVARTAGETHARGGVTLFWVDASLPGIAISPLKTIGGDKQFEVAFDRVTVPADAVLGRPGEGGDALEWLLDYAAVCKCAEMVGGAQRVLEMATAYAKQRRQFGKPIGSFQAIQHHCANMLIKLEGSRYMTYKAAWHIDNDLPCQMAVSATKAWVSESCKEIAALGHQVQGGSAFMAEHDMPLFSRRAAAAAVAFGDAAYHRNRVRRVLGL